jgi:hypothetical protein
MASANPHSVEAPHSLCFWPSKCHCACAICMYVRSGVMTRSDDIGQGEGCEGGKCMIPERDSAVPEEEDG